MRLCCDMSWWMEVLLPVRVIVYAGDGCYEHGGWTVTSTGWMDFYELYELTEAGALFFNKRTLYWACVQRGIDNPVALKGLVQPEITEQSDQRAARREKPAEVDSSHPVSSSGGDTGNLSPPLTLGITRSRE
jgi:hypothetical protein